MNLWEQLESRRLASEPTAVATVVSTFGSAPLRPGSIMICGADGTVAGSVSGGCVEGAVYELAQQVLVDGRPVLEHFGVSDELAGQVGLTCGGRISVYVEPAFPSVGPLVAHLRAGRPVALATVIGGGHVVCTPSTAPSTAIVAAARSLLARGESGLVSLPEGEVFVNCLLPRPRMLVYGSSEFAAAMVRQGRLLGRQVTVCDARPAFTSRERFPEADEVVVDWPHRHLAAEAAAGRLDPRTVLISMTHDPKFEVPLLQTALSLDLSYVGAMASRRSASRCRSLLREAGVPAERLTRLSSPVGLDLGGDTPEEAALATAAEIQLLTRSGSASRLTGTRGPIHRRPEFVCGPQPRLPAPDVMTEPFSTWRGRQLPPPVDGPALTGSVPG